MKKSRYTEEQMVFALKQAEVGCSVAEVCRKMAFPKPPTSINRRPVMIAPSDSAFGRLRKRGYVMALSEFTFYCAAKVG